MDTINPNKTILEGGLNGEVSGRANLTSGINGAALYLDGIKQSVEFNEGLSSCLLGLHDCRDGSTLSVWVRVGWKDVESTQMLHYITSGSYASSACGIGIYKRDSSIYVIYKTGKKKWEVESQKVSNGDWNHVTVTWSEAGKLYLYLNGSLAVDGQKPSLLSRGCSRAAGPLTLGRPNHDKDLSKLYGEVHLDDLLLWEEEKSALFVKQLWLSYSSKYISMILCMRTIQYIQTMSLHVDVTYYIPTGRYL